MKSTTLLTALVIGLSVGGYAQAEVCANQGGQKYPGLMANLASLFSDKPAPCGSLKSVLDKLANHSRPGGRRLEDDKPFDPKQAQEEMDSALQDTAIQSHFQELDKSATDPDTRLVLKAIILDDEGYYSARDSLILKLQH